MPNLAWFTKEGYSNFRRWWKKKVWDSTTENELRIALKKFFTFLADEHGIINEKVLIALK